MTKYINTLKNTNQKGGKNFKNEKKKSYNIEFWNAEFQMEIYHIIVRHIYLSKFNLQVKSIYNQDIKNFILTQKDATKSHEMSGHDN